MGDVHWVLRNARLHAADASLRSAAGLARALGDPAPHRAQIARWENGQVALTHRIVRGYEDTLGLPEGQLLRAIDIAARESTPVNVLPTVPPPLPEDITPEALPLLEQALQYDRMTGLDWDRLTTLLGSTAHVLVRERDWESLLYRLSVEASVSTGLEYVHRWEASARLVGMPRSSQIVIEMTESALKDDDVQLYSDYATLLRYCPDPRGHEVLTEVILEPRNPRVLWASLATLATLVSHHSVDEVLVAKLMPRAVEILGDESLPLRTRRAATSLVEHSDDYGPSVILPSATRREVERVLRSSELRPDRRQDLSTRILARLAELTPRDADDDTLRDLVDAALGEPHLDTHDTALALLLLSGQGSATGTVLGERLGEAVAEGEFVQVRNFLSMLSWLVQPDSLDLLTTLTTGNGYPPEVAAGAAAALGNCPEPAGADRLARDEALATYGRDRILLRHRDKSAPAGNAWGICYALGMRGRFDVIESLSLMPECRREREWQSSLGWWLELAEAVRPVST